MEPGFAQIKAFCLYIENPLPAENGKLVHRKASSSVKFICVKRLVCGLTINKSALEMLVSQGGHLCARRGPR